MDWTGGLDWWTGLVDCMNWWTAWTGGLHELVDWWTAWTGGLDWWTAWTGGLTLKFVSQQLVKAHLPVELCGNPARSLLSACIVLKQTSYYYNSEDLYT